MSHVPVPEFRLIPVARLTVDQSVQRSLDKLRVDKIAGDYQEAAIGVLVVNERTDGTIHVIDGQHRLAATIAAGHGDKTLPCMVYTGLSRAAEAAMFRRLNNARPVSVLDKFKVRVVEGEPAAVALNAVLERHGWKANFSKHDGHFAAIAAFEGIYKGTSRGKIGEHIDVCETVIRVVTQAWDHNPDGVRAEVIGGIGAVLLRHGDRVDLAKLVAELGTFPGGPRALVGKAKGLRDYRGGTVSDSFAEVLVSLINKSRRTNRLPAWHGE